MFHRCNGDVGVELLRMIYPVCTLIHVLVYIFQSDTRSMLTIANLSSFYSVTLIRADTELSLLFIAAV